MSNGMAWVICVAMVCLTILIIYFNGYYSGK